MSTSCDRTIQVGDRTYHCIINHENEDPLFAGQTTHTTVAILVADGKWDTFVELIWHRRNNPNRKVDTTENMVIIDNPFREFRQARLKLPADFIPLMERFVKWYDTSHSH